MDGKAVLKKVLGYVNLKGLIVEWVMREVVKPKLEEIVKDSSNPFDDALLSYVYPIVETEVAKAVDKLDAE